MKVGDYVRTTDGISKIIDIRYNKRVGYLVLTDDYNNIWYKQREIIKSSPNIIDLIEVGDYVNGMRVKDINNIAGFVIVNTSSISENTIFTYNIKSIVTKEQFENCMYKVGD